VSFDENSSWDSDRAFERDFERESSPVRSTRRKLDPRGSVRISYVCPEEVHQAMKLDGRFDALPAAPRAEFILIDFEDGSPLEIHRYANCSCTSTIVKVVDTSDSPTWAATLERTGL
jgi:hypothetical protein